jgi:hypothetical protein
VHELLGRHDGRLLGTDPAGGAEHALVLGTGRDGGGRRPHAPVGRWGLRPGRSRRRRPHAPVGSRGLRPGLDGRRGGRSRSRNRGGSGGLLAALQDPDHHLRLGRRLLGRGRLLAGRLGRGRPATRRSGLLGGRRRRHGRLRRPGGRRTNRRSGGFGRR